MGEILSCRMNFTVSACTCSCFAHRLWFLASTYHTGKFQVGWPVVREMGTKGGLGGRLVAIYFYLLVMFTHCLSVLATFSR